VSNFGSTWKARIVFFNLLEAPQATTPANYSAMRRHVVLTPMQQVSQLDP
jgi:hypothetical protein